MTQTLTPAKLNQSGQAILEAILILTIMMGLTLVTARFFNDEEVVKRLITGPFTNLSGMLQNGVWAPPAQGAAAHPSNHYRHIVIEGEAVR
ncbi:MAG: hypothetical protein KF799_02960 [Bdellovibrionales bacterium]|nr:hypothetical protein [Bdellovibrionales bacterium]